MAELPTGTVTFLFTDIEGSTKLTRIAAGGVCWGALEAEENRGSIGQWETARHEYELELVPYEGAAFEWGRAWGQHFSVDEAVAFALSVD